MPAESSVAAKHTPGPWTSGFAQAVTGRTACQWHYMPNWDTDALTGGFHIVQKEDGVSLGTASIIAVLPKADPNWEANARLIAAAPDLLAALRGFVEMYVPMVKSGDCGNWDAETEPQVIAARAAIAKAVQS